MARKITFHVSPDEMANPDTGVKPAPALAGMARSLQAAAAASVRDLDVALIEDSPHQDRLEIDPDEIAELAQSIRQNGQLVPILVSPLPAGRFRIVYGRRRLLALRQLGQVAKALVRDLSDDQAIIAQGQENSARKDLSFIEKAAFAGQLMAEGKSDDLIADALNIDQKARANGDKLTNLSRIRQVIQRISPDLIRAIGAAPSFGRDRWYSLAQDIEKAGFPPGNQADFIKAAEVRKGTSDDRFTAVERAIPSKAKAPPQARPKTLATEAPAIVKTTALKATITVSITTAKDLHAWIRKNPQAAIDALLEAQAKSKQ